MENVRMIRSPKGIEQHSDAGYGCPSIAMRDGLIAYHGLPEQDVRKSAG